MEQKITPDRWNRLYNRFYNRWNKSQIILYMKFMQQISILMLKTVKTLILALIIEIKITGDKMKRVTPLFHYSTKYHYSMFYTDVFKKHENSLQ